MKANSGNDSSGHESKSGELQSKMADEIFTLKTFCPTVAPNRVRRNNLFQDYAPKRPAIASPLAFRRRSAEHFRVRPPPRKNSASARARVLAQWRGVDYAPLEKARATPARSAAEVLPGLMKELRLDARQAEAELVKVWNELDPAITAHAQPANLHKGTLFVNVDSSVWLNEIVRYRRKEILERLQNSFGKSVVQKISFRIG